MRPAVQIQTYTANIVRPVSSIIGTGDAVETGDNRGPSALTVTGRAILPGPPAGACQGQAAR